MRTRRRYLRALSDPVILLTEMLTEMVDLGVMLNNTSKSPEQESYTTIRFRKPWQL